MFFDFIINRLVGLFGNDSIDVQVSINAGVEFQKLIFSIGEEGVSCLLLGFVFEFCCILVQTLVWVVGFWIEGFLFFLSLENFQKVSVFRIFLSG